MAEPTTISDHNAATVRRVLRTFVRHEMDFS